MSNKHSLACHRTKKETQGNAADSPVRLGFESKPRSWVATLDASLLFYCRWVASDKRPRSHIFAHNGTGGNYGSFSKAHTGTDKCSCANPSSVFDYDRGVGKSHLWIRYIVTPSAQKRLHAYCAMRSDLDTIDRIDLHARSNGRVLAYLYSGWIPYHRGGINITARLELGTKQAQ
jgi:hypothetical protein